MTMPTTAARRAVAATALLITGLLLALGLLLAGVVRRHPAERRPGRRIGQRHQRDRGPGGQHRLGPAGPPFAQRSRRRRVPYNFGNPAARLVLHHVSYGTVSPYQQVPAGEYTVSMRAAGAKGSAPPILSTGFAVDRGDAYTVAGMGPASGLRLQVMDDRLTAPAGHALVRVIQASLRQHVVTLSLGQVTLALGSELRQHHLLPAGQRGPGRRPGRRPQRAHLDGRLDAATRSRPWSSWTAPRACSSPT